MRRILHMYKIALSYIESVSLIKAYDEISEDQRVFDLE